MRAPSKLGIGTGAAAVIVMAARSTAVRRVVFGAAASERHNVIYLVGDGIAAGMVAAVVVSSQDGESEPTPRPRIVSLAGGGVEVAAVCPATVRAAT